MSRPYVVFSLPRSRCAWIGAYLTYKDWVCLHNTSIAMQQIGDLDKILDRQKIGLADTSLALIWPEIVERIPQAKIVVVRRPIGEVLAAMQAQGYDPRACEQAVRRIEFALGEVESLSGVLKLDFKDLSKEATAKRLFEFCLPYKFDKDWWEFMEHTNVEQDHGVLQAKLVANAPGYYNTFAAASAYYDNRLKVRA